MIKSQYRKLSLKYHPDKNQNSKNSEELFKLVNEAYSILSDAEKKRKYDAEIKQSIVNMYKINDALAKKKAESMLRYLFGDRDDTITNIGKFDEATYDFLYSVDKKSKFSTDDEKQKVKNTNQNPFGSQNAHKIHLNHEKFESEISTVRRDINKFNQKNSEMQKNLSKDNSQKKDFFKINKNNAKINQKNKDKISNLKKK